VRALENAAGNRRQRVLRPGFDVAQRAALEKQREHLAAEPAVEVLGLCKLAKLFRDLDQHVFSCERTDLVFELAELVGPQIDERAHAAARCGVEPIG